MTQNRPIALALRGVSKRFDRLAVDALDLTVHGGEFYALVGPNGAGKTTTLRMVVGLLRPDAGSICVDGIDALADPVTAKQITAWLSDEPMIYEKLTPYEYLEFVERLWRIESATAEARARELIGWLGLEPHAHERCEGFSKGMRQKVAPRRRARPRPEADHPRRAIDRPRRRHGPSSEECASRARACRRDRHHDHAYSRGGGAHGRSHRRHCGRAAHSRRYT